MDAESLLLAFPILLCLSSKDWVTAFGVLHTHKKCKNGNNSSFLNRILLVPVSLNLFNDLPPVKKGSTAIIHYFIIIIYLLFIITIFNHFKLYL